MILLLFLTSGSWFVTWWVLTCLVCCHESRVMHFKFKEYNVVYGKLTFHYTLHFLFSDSTDVFCVRRILFFIYICCVNIKWFALENGLNVFSFTSTCLYVGWVCAGIFLLAIGIVWNNSFIHTKRKGTLDNVLVQFDFAVGGSIRLIFFLESFCYGEKCF